MAYNKYIHFVRLDSPTCFEPSSTPASVLPIRKQTSRFMKSRRRADSQDVSCSGFPQAPSSAQPARSRAPDCLGVQSQIPGGVVGRLRHRSFALWFRRRPAQLSGLSFLNGLAYGHLRCHATAYELPLTRQHSGDNFGTEQRRIRIDLRILTL